MVEEQSPREREPAYKGTLGKALRFVEIIEISVGALLLAAILVLIMAQVVVRFTPLGGWVWTGELARFSLVWLTFATVGYLIMRDKHISIDIVNHLLPHRGRRVVEIIAHLVVAAICAAMFYEGLALVRTQSGIRSSAAEISLAFVYAIPTIGFALGAVRALIRPFVGKEST